MISPNVTTLRVIRSRYARRAQRAATFATIRRHRPRARVVAGRDRLGVEQRRADADRDRAGANPVAGVVDRDPAGRHQLDLRQRSAHVLEEPRSERRRRKDLHDVGARVPAPSRISVGVKQPGSAGTSRSWHASMTARRNTGLTTNCAPASITRTRRLGVEHRARAEQEPVGQRRRELANHLDRAAAPSS